MGSNITLLQDTLQEKGKELDDAMIPAINLFTGKNWANVIRFFPLEQREGEYGLGPLPLMRVSGPAEPSFPTRTELGKELAALMNSAKQAKVLKTKDFEQFLVDGAQWPTQEPTPGMEWPFVEESPGEYNLHTFK